MKTVKHLLLVLVTVLSCIGGDQATKAVAKAYLPRNDVISFARDTVRLQYTENEGAFLSLGAALPERARTAVFVVGVAVAMALLLAYLLAYPPASRTRTFALSLIAGGGVSNLVDRLAYGGHVVDFMNVGLGGVRTGIFNVADMAILLGAILVVLGGSRHRRGHGG